MGIQLFEPTFSTLIQIFNVVNLKFVILVQILKGKRSSFKLNLANFIDI